MTARIDPGILFSTEMITALITGKKTQTRRLDLRWARQPVGALIWVRETWGPREGREYPNGVHFKANGDDGGPWKPSIHLRRRDSRLTLEITKRPRIEPLHAITASDAAAEGVAGPAHRKEFMGLWVSIHGQASLLANPQVAVLTFRVHHGNIDDIRKHLTRTANAETTAP